MRGNVDPYIALRISGIAEKTILIDKKRLAVIGVGRNRGGCWRGFRRGAFTGGRFRLRAFTGRWGRRRGGCRRRSRRGGGCRCRCWGWRGLRLAVLVVAGQDNRRLRPCGLAGGIKTIARLTADDLIGLGPVHRRYRPGRNLIGIGIGCAGTGGRAAGIAPQNGGHLLPGHRVVGTKSLTAVTGYIAALLGPQHCIRVPGIGLCIGKAVLSAHSRAAGHAIKYRSQHGTAHGKFRGKQAAGNTAHQAIVIYIGYRAGIPHAGGYVCKRVTNSGSRNGSNRYGKHSRQQCACQQPGCSSLFHDGFSFLSGGFRPYRRISLL